MTFPYTVVLWNAVDKQLTFQYTAKPLRFDEAKVVEISLDREKCLVRFIIAFDDDRIIASAKVAEFLMGNQVVHQIETWKDFPVAVRNALDDDIGLARLLLNQQLAKMGKDFKISPPS